MTAREKTCPKPDRSRSRRRAARCLAASPVALALLGACSSGEPRASRALAEVDPAGLENPEPTARRGDEVALDGDSPAPGSELACNAEALDAGSSVLRRLSQREYALTLTDLLELPEPPDLEGIVDDVRRDGFSVFSELQSVTAQHLRAYLDEAQELSRALSRDAERFELVVGCTPGEGDCLREFIARFGRLAWRRPLEAEEVEALAVRAERAGGDPRDAVGFALEALISSPSFLYRVEVGGGDAPLAELRPYELASRLAFSLWGRAPHAELLDRAEAGELATPEGLSRAAGEMLLDERARSHFATFFRQWLGFDELRAPVEPSDDWQDGLLVDMQSETDRMLGEYAWGGGDFLDVLVADHTWSSPELATFSGLPEPDADGRVELPASHFRAKTGVLTHPSLLSAKSDGDLIAKRGNWLRSTFLCSKLEIPAAVAEMLGELLVGLTRVEIVQKRNAESACRGCHSVIDPIGVAFAQYDAAGRFDPSLDPSVYGVTPALPDAPDPSFDGLAELSEKLRAMPEVSECLSSKVFLYLGGREPEAQDACSLSAARRRFMNESFDFSVLVQGLVNAPEFRYRRAPGAEEPSP